LVAALLSATAPAIAHTGSHVPAAGNSLRRTTLRPAIPQVMLVRDDGTRVNVARELDAEPAVILNFVFLSCTTVCPVSSRIMAEVQTRLGAAQTGVRLLSISIDPENDPQPRLAAYARSLGRAPGWHFYTGRLADSEAVQRAFGVWRPDRMDHPVATFVRSQRDGDWVRIDGFASPEVLLAEVGAACATAARP
jgi:protein SCO1/2